MTTNIINCSGALFSSLQFELINNKKLQEGFLLGHIEKVTSHSISDSEINNENTVISINLTGFIPCSSMGTFYSGAGKVNFPYLKQSLQHNIERVVGWYHCRKFSDSLYLKEMRIHEQLREGMPHSNGHFIFALFSRPQPADTGTMSVNYKFHVMLNNNEFEGVPLRIINMSDTSTSQYIRSTPSSALYSSKSLQTILEGFEHMEPGIKEVEILHNGLLIQLRNLLPKYASVQEQHNKALFIVNKLREFCYRSEIRTDFEPGTSKECDFNLMDLEPPSPKARAKQASSSTKITLNSPKPSGTPNAKKKDPFSFVVKEMEKQQENEGSLRKIARAKKDQALSISSNSCSKSGAEETNASKSKVKSKVVRKLSTDEESQRVTRNSNDKSVKITRAANASPRRNSREATPIKAIPQKANKNLRSPKNSSSAEDKASPVNTRHRSPSNSKTPNKLKEKEAWTDNKMVMDSPEY